jgi:hypothetical protein
MPFRRGNAVVVGAYDEVDSPRGTDDMRGGETVELNEFAVQTLISVCLFLEDGFVVDGSEPVEERHCVGRHGHQWMC